MTNAVKTRQKHAVERNGLNGTPSSKGVQPVALQPKRLDQILAQLPKQVAVGKDIPLKDIHAAHTARIIKGPKGFHQLEIDRKTSTGNEETRQVKLHQKTRAKLPSLIG